MARGRFVGDVMGITEHFADFLLWRRRMASGQARRRHLRVRSGSKKEGQAAAAVFLADAGQVLQFIDQPFPRGQQKSGMHDV